MSDFTPLRYPGVKPIEMPVHVKILYPLGYRMEWLIRIELWGIHSESIGYSQTKFNFVRILKFISIGFRTGGSLMEK